MIEQAALMSAKCSPEQRRAVNTLTRARGGVVWWKVGEGKTRIALFTFARLHHVYQWSLPSVCLVVCRRASFSDWRREISSCFGERSVYEDSIPAHPLGDKPVFLLVSHGQMNRSKDTWLSLCEDANIRFVVLDESWLYANNKSERSKAVRALCKDRKAIALSGTIMKARDLCEIYSQLWAVRKEGYLASSLSKFKTLFLKEKWIEGQSKGFKKVYARKGAYKRIIADLQDIADINFPKGTRRIHEQFHNIEATSKQRRLFAELRETYSVDELDLEFNHAIVIGIKAQQIANGWIKNAKGEIVSIPSNKPEKLKDELSDIIASGERAVVWCAFRYDVEMLADYLDFATLQMRGGAAFDLDRWQYGDIKVCLATEASGSSVNHFAHTPFAIYYSADYKWINMQQSRGRTDRKSSSHSDCFYKYLQVDGSMDSHVYRCALESGRHERKLIIEATTQWLKL